MDASMSYSLDFPHGLICASFRFRVQGLGVGTWAPDWGTILRTNYIKLREGPLCPLFWKVH